MLVPGCMTGCVSLSQIAYTVQHSPLTLQRELHLGLPFLMGIVPMMHDASQ